MNTPQTATAIASVPRLLPSYIEAAEAIADALEKTDYNRAVLKALCREVRASWDDAERLRLAGKATRSEFEAYRLATKQHAEKVYANGGKQMLDYESQIEELTKQIAAKDEEIEAGRKVAFQFLERREAERDAARADAAALRAIAEMANVLCGMPCCEDHEIQNLRQLELALFALPDANPGAPLLALRDAAAAFVRVTVGGDDVAEVAALRKAVANLGETK